jgi:hypothetical protein
MHRRSLDDSLVRLGEVTDECNVPLRGDGGNRLHGENKRCGWAESHGWSFVSEPSLQPTAEAGFRFRQLAFKKP